MNATALPESGQCIRGARRLMWRSAIPQVAALLLATYKTLSPWLRDDQVRSIRALP